MQKNKSHQISTPERMKPPFNDVMDHFDKVDGGRPEKIEPKTLPRPIRFIGYFVIGWIVIMTVFGIIISFINQ